MQLLSTQKIALLSFDLKYGYALATRKVFCSLVKNLIFLIT